MFNDVISASKRIEKGMDSERIKRIINSVLDKRRNILDNAK